jgi:hypothetical protein
LAKKNMWRRKEKKNKEKQRKRGGREASTDRGNVHVEGVQEVLLTHQTSVEEGQPGRHEPHQRGADQEVGSVARVDTGGALRVEATCYCVVDHGC